MVEANEKSICDSCRQNNAELGVVLDGVYKKICYSCKPKPQVNSGHARWSRSLDLEDSEWMIQQPRNADGSINTKFAKLYPDKARMLFNEEELRKAEL